MPLRTTPRRARALTVTALALTGLAASALVGCGPPPGGTASVQGIGASTRLVFMAAAGRNNVVTVSALGSGAAGTVLRIDDTADEISAGNGCTPIDADSVRCDGVNFVELVLGDGDDSATNATGVPSKINSNTSAGIRGGPGDDVLRGGGSADGLSGDEGTDTLLGEGGDDVLVEATTPAAADIVDDDAFTGGPGRDLATWTHATTDLTITLDGVRNDGQQGEADRVEVEDVTGGDGADRVFGDAAANAFRGGDGDDRLIGYQGADRLVGDAGNDVLSEVSLHPGGYPDLVEAADALDPDIFDGGSGRDAASYRIGDRGVIVDLDGVADDGQPGEGDDVRPNVEGVYDSDGADLLIGNNGDNSLRGSRGDDVLDGGNGDDVLEDGVGRDQLLGRAGNDVLTAGFPNNGTALLDGGTETDTCNGSPPDTERDCEL